MVIFSREFRLEVGNDVDGALVRITGELDLATAPHLDQCLRGLTGPVVTLDFSSVTFIDASGIQALVVAQGRFRDEATKLVLFGVAPAQLRVFDIVGLAHYFDSLVPN